MWLALPGVWAYQIFFATGVGMTTPTLAAVLETMVPVMTAVIAVLAGVERFSLIRLLGLACAMLGAMRIVSRGETAAAAAAGHVNQGAAPRDYVRAHYGRAPRGPRDLEALGAAAAAGTSFAYALLDPAAAAGGGGGVEMDGLGGGDSEYPMGMDHHKHKHTFGASSAAGNMFVLASSLAYAIFTVQQKRVLSAAHSRSPLAITCLTSLVGGISVIASCALQGQPLWPEGASWAQIAGIAYTAGMTTITAYLLQSWASKATTPPAFKSTRGS